MMANKKTKQRTPKMQNPPKNTNQKVNKSASAKIKEHIHTQNPEMEFKRHHMSMEREKRLDWCKDIMAKELLCGNDWKEALKVVESGLVSKFSLGYHARKDYRFALESMKDEIDLEVRRKNNLIKAETDQTLRHIGVQT